MEWAIELQSLAQAGLTYGKDVYDRERYERIRDISAEILSYKTDISVEKVKKKIENADAVVIGAGAGLSTSAGFTYSGKRFEDNFADFIEKYGFKDMYSAGFYPYKTLEEHWAYWSRYIFINRYQSAPKSVYNDLYNLVQDKDYFVLTTNVDHCFQKAGLINTDCFIHRAIMVMAVLKTLSRYDL